MTNSLGKNHWIHGHKETKLWEQLISQAVGRSRPLRPLKHAKLKFRRNSSKAPDFDGLVSGFKKITDSLIKCGVIENDSFKHIGMPEFEWGLAKLGQGFIEVWIEEVTGPPSDQGARMV